MMFDDKPYTLDRIVRLALGTGLFIGLIWLISYLSDVLLPFAIALLGAYLINPVVVRFQRIIPKRGLAVAVTLVLVALLGLLVFVLVAPLIANEVSQMGKLISDLASNSSLAKEAAKRLPPDLWQAFKDYFNREEVRQFFAMDNIFTMGEMFLRKVLPGAWGIVTGAFSFLAGLFGLSVVGLYLAFLLLDWPNVEENWTKVLPAKYRDRTVALVKDFNQAMSRYFRAQALVAGIVGVLFAIGFMIIGLPLGLIMGLIVGLMNMVPYLQIIALIPAACLALIQALQTGSGFIEMMALTGLVFAVVQIIQDAILVPRIMGRAMDLSPAMILLSLAVWGKLLGFLGLLIAIPLTCFLWAAYQQFLVERS